MLKYIFKRVLIFIPTLIVISLMTFVISINAPGDPVETMLNQNMGGDGQSGEKLANEQTYIDKRKELGFDLPLFYFSFTNKTYPDTLYKIPRKAHRETLQRLSYEYGVWENVGQYYKNLQKLELKVFEVMPNEENSSKLRKIKDNLSSLYLTYEEDKIKQTVENIEFDIFKDKNIKLSVEKEFFDFKNSYEHMLVDKKTINRYIPTIYWYGLKNQYHQWISNFVVGEFGISYQDKRPVSSKIFDALKWSMILSILSIVIAYMVAIPLGVRSAVDKGKTSEKIITTGLFLLYSLPNFWVATMLIQYLGDGDGLGWFPTHGLGELPETAPYWDRFFETAYHFILPLFCLTYASFAFISRQMRGGMLNVLEMDYIRTARAKGLKKQVVVWKHAFRNSLIPIITLFANIFPAAISGSFIIEVIFSIPGMGQLTLQAIFQRDYPIVFTVLMFSSILTLVGILIADIMYAFVDPRISFSNKKS
ncbi:MAG TPA: ABC transporter permease subunit [Vicingaceae bacterium]|nr:ABC transporter permease subunit [Vicingaceae bacterium]